MNTFNLKLDLDKARKTLRNNVVTIRKGDLEGTTIVATLYDHGELFTDSGLTAMMEMLQPDRQHYYRGEADYDDGVITITLDETYAASVTGETDVAYFRLYDGDEVIASTEPFRVIILRDAIDAAGGPAESYDELGIAGVKAWMDEHPEERVLIDDGSVADVKLDPKGTPMDLKHTVLGDVAVPAFEQGNISYNADTHVISYINHAKTVRSPRNTFLNLTRGDHIDSSDNNVKILIAKVHYDSDGNLIFEKWTNSWTDRFSMYIWESGSYILLARHVDGTDLTPTQAAAAITVTRTGSASTYDRDEIWATIFGGTEVPMFEPGDCYRNDDDILATRNNAKRVRQVWPQVYRLVEGDEFHSSSSDIVFLLNKVQLQPNGDILWLGNTGGTYLTDYTIPENGMYQIIVAKSDETNIVPADAAAAITLTRRGIGADAMERTWTIEKVTLFDNVELRDTNHIDSSQIDTSDVGMISLRVDNALKDSNGDYVQVQMRFQSEGGSGSYNTRDANGEAILLTFGGGYHFVTPDDLPILNHLQWLRIRAAAVTTPASGNLRVKAILKR